MRQHLIILAGLLKEKKLRQEDVALALGYKSPSAIGMMLRGERGMDRGVLAGMCELVGITIVALAAMSDDLVIAKTPEAVEGAAILDTLSREQLDVLMPLLRGYRPKPLDS